MAHCGIVATLMEGQSARARTHDGSAWEWTSATPDSLRVEPAGGNPSNSAVLTVLRLSAADPQPVVVLRKAGAEPQCFSFNATHANLPPGRLERLEIMLTVPAVAPPIPEPEPASEDPDETSPRA